jgi:hypothetical protein
MTHGHTKFAYLGDRTDIQTARERRRGFIEEVGRAGHSRPPRFPSRRSFTTRKRRGGPPFSLTSEDLRRPSSPARTSSRSAMRALKELGASKRVALVGFDDFTLADMMEPGVTVIAQHPDRIGKLPPNGCWPGSMATTTLRRPTLSPPSSSKAAPAKSARRHNPFPKRTAPPPNQPERRIMTKTLYAEFTVKAGSEARVAEMMRRTHRARPQ